MSLTRALLPAAAAVLALPAAASAQIYGGTSSPYSPYGGGYVPYRLGVTNPLINRTQFYYRTTSIPTPLGQMTTWRAYYGNNSTIAYAPVGGSSVYQPRPGYMSGGAGGAAPVNPALMQAQREAAQVRRQAAAMAGGEGQVRKQIFDQWAYDRLGVAGLADPRLKAGPEVLQQALAATDEEELASGVLLNHILVSTVGLQGRGVRAAGAFLPPEVMAEVRFGGSPAADALNVLRSAARPDFPTVFEAEALRGDKAAIDRDLRAVAAAAGAGRVDVQALNDLAATVRAAQERAAPLTQDLPFEEATATRKFLNGLGAVTKVLREPGMARLLNPKWSMEGAKVDDLVRHMAQYKLLFGPAPKGEEAAYLAVHQALAGFHGDLAKVGAK